MMPSYYLQLLILIPVVITHASVPVEVIFLEHLFKCRHLPFGTNYQLSLEILSDFSVNHTNFFCPHPKNL